MRRVSRLDAMTTGLIEVQTAVLERYLTPHEPTLSAPNRRTLGNITR